MFDLSTLVQRKYKKFRLRLVLTMQGKAKGN